MSANLPKLFRLVGDPGPVGDCYALVRNETGYPITRDPF